MKQPYSIPRGIRRSGIPVTVVCGAPGSGKTTYVRTQASERDTVIDFDDIRKIVGGHRYANDADLLKRAYAYRDMLLHSLASKRTGRAWLVVMAPTRAERLAWVAVLGNATVHAIDTPQDECKRRVAGDPSRSGQVDRLNRAIERYFQEQANESNGRQSQRGQPQGVAHPQAHGGGKGGGGPVCA